MNRVDIFSDEFQPHLNNSVMPYNEPVIHVVDQIPGAGKTTAAINYINSLPEDSKIMFVTPFNNKETDKNGNFKNANEVDRIIHACPNKHFQEPEERPNKIESIKRLLNKGANIATTHALFSMFDDDIIELCYSQGYILFMDEVTNVIEPYKKISGEDLKMLKEQGYITVDPTTNLLIWDESRNYKGKFQDEMIMCKNRCLAIYGKNVSLWLFPVRIFEAFQETYILTYMFEAQMQNYYYKFNNLKYDYMYVTGDSIDTYRFTSDYTESKPKYDYSKLIHIVQNPKLNRIGSYDYSLSKSWYENHFDYEKKLPKALMNDLQKNTYNFFNNITPQGKASNNLWTTFKDFKPYLKGNGYTKGFLVHTARATNAYVGCHNVAYLVNKYLNPYVKNFFIGNNIKVDEDGYALSEMLQFIWRSAIRSGEEIYIYVPSIRMRTLLENWIKANPQAEKYKN